MEENQASFATIKQKAIHGVISLTFRRIIIFLVTTAVTNLYLAHLLSPAIIGTFNLANTIVSFFGFFADIGLAASLIQKREQVSREDLTTTFVIQESLVTIISLVLFMAAPYIAQSYSLDHDGVVLIQALAASFFLISLKVIPSVLLERELNFRPLVTVELIETILFNVVLVIFVLQGYGLLAYAIAVLLRALVGVLLLYLFSPWKLGLQFSKQAAQQLLHFGLPYQTNSVLALLKDKLVVLVVAKMLTPSERGYVTMAQFLAFLPLEVMNIIIRVTFPTYAKLQQDRAVLGRAVERSLYIMGLCLYPSVFGILALVPNLVEVVGREKWGPIIPLVYLFSLATLWASLSTTFTNVFNAVGEVKLTLKLMVMWTALEWLLTPVLVWRFGFIGVALASGIISFSSIATVLLMRRIAPIKLLPTIGKPLIASALMAVFLFPLARLFLTSKLMLIPLILVGGALYVLIIFIWDNKRLVAEARDISHALR